jgi:hypothetical protein
VQGGKSSFAGFLGDAEGDSLPSGKWGVVFCSAILAPNLPFQPFEACSHSTALPPLSRSPCFLPPSSTISSDREEQFSWREAALKHCFEGSRRAYQARYSRICVEQV